MLRSVGAVDRALGSVRKVLETTQASGLDGLGQTLYRQANKRLIQLQEQVVRNDWVIGSPFHLVLDTGNLCNLRCPLCPTPTREKRIPKGQLTYENAKIIIDRFPALLHMNLSCWGEPFLNKDIFRIIRYGADKNIDVLIETNLNRFDAANTRKLIESGLSTLQISLDGASHETYKRMRVGGQFDRVMANINLIRDLQTKLGVDRPRILWKMIVHRHNEHEIEKARQMAHELGVDFTLNEVWVPDKLADQWVPVAEGAATRAHRDAETGVAEKCFSLWQVAMVNFNGDVFPCCSEFTPKDALGNLLETDLKTIWNSPRYRAMRRNNRGDIKCGPCHLDKGTQWYQLWMEGRNDRESLGPSHF